MSILNKLNNLAKEWKTLCSDFMAIGGYKDAGMLAEECKQKSSALQARVKKDDQKEVE